MSEQFQRATPSYCAKPVELSSIGIVMCGPDYIMLATSAVQCLNGTQNLAICPITEVTSSWHSSSFNNCLFRTKIFIAHDVSDLTVYG